MRAALGAAAMALAISIGSDIAGAQNADCQQLRAQIAAAGQASARSPGAAYDAAAQKQRAEIDRTVAYSRQIGCDRKKFLFFGSDPPAQCGEIYAQVARMQANLGQLQSKGSGGVDRGALVARYQAECSDNDSRPHGILEALFGNPRQEPSSRVTDVPLTPDPNATAPTAPETTVGEGTEAHAGSKEVCVRTCDGYFFPIGYSGSGGRSGDLQEMCKALCPNAEVALYSYPPSGDINEAVGADGTHYADLPNALKYRKSVDGACSCKRRGQSWAQALAEAEALLGERKTDIIVTQEKSDELSRVKPDPKAKPGKTPADPAKAAADLAKANAGADSGKPPATDPKNPVVPGAAQDSSPTDVLLSQQSATVSRENSGIASDDTVSGPAYSKGQGQTEDVTGPDGVKRRVRIIDPTL